MAKKGIIEKSKLTKGSLAFQEILRGLIKERSLTLEQIAGLSGVGKSVVAGWLNGATPHDLHAIDRLATALGISFKSLLLGKPETVEGIQSIAELYDEVDLFDGLCRVSLRKLVPRKSQ